MGLLDSILGSAVPGGNLSKPLMIALTALLAARATGAGGIGSLFGGGISPQPPQGASGPPEPSQRQGRLLGGLGGLLQSFQQSGHGDVINSWIAPGQNKPIAPDQLHQALGPEAVDNLSRMTGVPQNELLAELARVLPGVVDRLTPQGRMPEHSEMSRW